ncbi:MAG TPA: AAA family ATPase [Deltaproteobacteria bacterium]|nr:AAA family ATPase [Deltaproteobacteria bacterium]
MYLKHFGLSRMPFESISNGSVYVDVPEHREAFNTVVFGLRSGDGFIKIVGEVGMGKTALCRNLLSRLEPRFRKIYLPNPAIHGRDLLLSIADELAIDVPAEAGLHMLQKVIRDELIETTRRGGRVAVFVDEAQTMPGDTLEELRLLSNLESNHGKLVQVVLFGQPELDENLAAYSLRQLQQRIAFSARLLPLDRHSCRQYIDRRLARAGAGANPIFSAPTRRRIHRASGGIPRLINVLCHKSLIAAFTEGTRQVEPRHVARAIRDTEGLARWRNPGLSPGWTAIHPGRTRWSRRPWFSFRQGNGFDEPHQ